MDRLHYAHAWATLFVSIAVIFFFTFSVAFLSHGVFLLTFFSAILILTGLYCIFRYYVKDVSSDFKIMALLNVSLISGFLPKLGMKYMQSGVIAPYFWLSLVTINLAYSMAIIIFYDMRVAKVFK